MVRVGRVLSAQPALLSLSVEANLRPKLAFLRELGHFTSTPLHFCPHLPGPWLVPQKNDIARMTPCLVFARAHARAGMPQLGKQLDAYPALLTLSLETNLRPTAEALVAAGLLHRRTDGASGQLVVDLRPRHLAARRRALPIRRLISGACSGPSAGTSRYLPLLRPCSSRKYTHSYRVLLLIPFGARWRPGRVNICLRPRPRFSHRPLSALLPEPSLNLP